MPEIGEIVLVTSNSY